MRSAVTGEEGKLGGRTSVGAGYKTSHLLETHQHTIKGTTAGLEKVSFPQGEAGANRKIKDWQKFQNGSRQSTSVDTCC